MEGCRSCGCWCHGRAAVGQRTAAARAVRSAQLLPRIGQLRKLTAALLRLAKPACFRVCMERHTLEGHAGQERAPDANERRRSVADCLLQAFGIDLLDAETILAHTYGKRWMASCIAHTMVRMQMSVYQVLEIVHTVDLPTLMQTVNLIKSWLEELGVVLGPAREEPDWALWRTMV